MRSRNAEYLSGPITTYTSTHQEVMAPVAHDYVKAIFIRTGSMVLLSEFGECFAVPGDVVILGQNTLCAGEPMDDVTVTTVLLDPDYMIDQVFWQYVSVLSDRLHAQQLAETIYAEPTQLLRLGRHRAGALIPWLDELTVLSIEDQPVKNFYRMQALWFSVADIVTPFVKTTPIRRTSTQRATTWQTQPRLRLLTPLRSEARKIADLLRSQSARQWSVSELAREVHLSKSQVGRVFVEAFGKSPIAYLTMLRAEQMAHLLRTTDAPIAMIGREVGWRDPNFAARQFRRSIGITPSRYRDLTRKWTELGAGDSSIE